MATKQTPSPSKGARSPRKPTNEDAQRAIKEALAAKECPSVLAVVSPDRIRREKVVSAFMGRFSKEGSGVSAQDHFLIRGRELNEKGVKELAVSLQHRSLFGSKRAFQIQEPELATNGTLKALSKLIPSLSPEDLFIVSAAKLPTTSPLHAPLKRRGALFVLPALSNSDLLRWTARAAQQSGLENLSKRALERIIESSGNSPDKITQTIERITLTFGDDPFTEEDLRALCPVEFDESEFTLVDAIQSGKIGHCELLVAQLLQSGKNAFLLLALLAKAYGTLFSIRIELDRGRTQQSIRTRLALSSWIFNRYLPIAQSLSQRALQEKLGAIVRADSLLKNHSLGEHAILSELAHSLMKG